MREKLRTQRWALGLVMLVILVALAAIFWRRVAILWCAALASLGPATASGLIAWNAGALAHLGLNSKIGS